MIDIQQSEFIKDNIGCSDHDYYFWSLILGEPFLYQDILCYYDGITLSVIGLPLNSKITEVDALRKISEVVETWIQNKDIKFISYFGPWYLTLDNVLDKSFQLFYSQDPKPYNVDVFLDLKSPKTLKTRNAKESIRKVRRQGLKVNIRDRAFLTYEHINLIRQLIIKHSISLDEISCLTTIGTFLRNGHTLFFEVEICNQLAGFAVVHEYFENRPFLLFVCLDRNYKYVSDALYSAIIEFYLAKGAHWISFGYSGDKGLYEYKAKWGETRCNLPFHQLYWKKGIIQNRSSLYCLHWPAALLLDNM